MHYSREFGQTFKSAAPLPLDSIRSVYVMISTNVYTDWCTPWHRLWAFFRSDHFSEKNDLIIFQSLSRCNSALKLPFPTWHMEYLHNDSNKCLYCYRAQMNPIIASLACRDTIYTSVLSNKFWPLPSCYYYTILFWNAL